MKIKINITKEVLRKTMFCGFIIPPKGDYFTNPLSRGNSGNCAIAYAVYKLFPYAAVSTKLITFFANKPDFNAKKGYVVRLPLEATMFIERFDKLLPHQRIALSPFSFTIIVPDHVIHLINIDEVKEIISESQTLELV